VVRTRSSRVGRVSEGRKLTAKSDNPVSDRALHFLKALVERYIRDGQPVGSRTLAKDTGLELSPATVRNVMSDLEDLGLVSSLHTSSGRVPTVSGYRLFLDTLLTVRPPAETEVDEMRRRFAALDDSPALIATASQVLSGVTRLAGVVMLPRRERNAFRQIEFLPLSGDRVLAILVTDEGEVHNRVIHTDERYSPSQLEQAANYLNSPVSGTRHARGSATAPGGDAPHPRPPGPAGTPGGGSGPAGGGGGGG
jgi:heat-inducible transcriptional repressor